jgi:hypothetical protein
MRPKKRVVIIDANEVGRDMLAFVACQWGYKVIALATAACLGEAAKLDTGEVTVVVKYPTLKDVEALNDYRAVNAELRVLTLEPQFSMGHRSLIADDRMLADRCMSVCRICGTGSK